MINKRMGTKIMAVLLAAVVALPSAGTVMAAEPVPAKTESGDTNESNESEESLWESLFRSAYPKSDSTGEGKGTQSGTKSSTTTDTGTGEIKVALSVAVAEGIQYGDSLEDKITVTATNVKDNTELENFTEYELKYYDKDKKALEEAPKDAGEYYVEASVKEGDRYKGDTTEQMPFAIAQKPIKLVLEDQRIDINNKEEKLPETYVLKLAEDSSLAYDEKFQEGYPQASYDIMKGDETISPDAPLQAGKYILKVKHDSINLGLAGDAKKANYQIEPVENAELIAADMLKLEVTGDKEFQYGDFDDSKFLKSAVTAVNAQGEEEKLDEKRLSIKYYDAEDRELSELPRNAGKYKVAAVYEYDETDQKAGESDKVSFEITKREIEIQLDSFEIENGAELPTQEELNKKLTITGLVKEGDEEKLPYEDEWEIAPRAYFEDEDIDTTADGEYKILFEAKLAEANYDLTVPEFATMTIGKPDGEEKDELTLELEDVSVVYGESVEDTVKAGIKATDKEGAVEELAADKFVLKYYDAAGTELSEAPVDVAEDGYQVKAVFKEDGKYKEAESEIVKLMITKREITIKAKNYGLANGKALPEKFDLEEEVKLSYEDQWAEGGEPRAMLKDENIDTTVAGAYEIIVSAAVEETKKGNYEIKLESGTLRIAKLNADTGKSMDTLSLAEGTVTSKVYDGKAFENPIPREAVLSEFDYKGELEYIWSTSDGNAPKDAGSYKMNIRIPASDPDWEGSMEVDLTIEKAEVTATAIPAVTETYAGEPVKCNIDTIGFVEGENWIKKPIVKVAEGDVNKAGAYKVQAAGGDAGNNYSIKYGEPATVNVLAERKPVISSVKFGKKDTYTAKYTGEQIRPTVAVTCNYTNEKGKAATQKLKLNVDYMVSYSENVNVGTATVTVQGIGEYAGVITKEFTITPKKIDKVTLSAVGDIKFENGVLPKPTVVVMDGNYELSEDDYEIEVKLKGASDFVTLDKVTDPGQGVHEKVELRIKAKDGGNYENGYSKKKAKFNILGSECSATPIANITFDMSCLKIPAKGYTYNGKTQKPKVTVKGADGKKLKSSEFKVVYSGNVNAGLAKVQIVGLYNKKKNTGYYGVSEPVYFEIKQKSFKKVSVSSVAAIPKSGSLESITLTVKDGKRILTEGLDYWVDYSKIIDEKGQILSDKITVGQKYDVTLYAYDGGNYLTTGEDGKRVVKVKFGQLNLASKTAKIHLTLTSADASGVSVVYNGVPLTQGIDYTVSKIKQDRKTGKYTVTIKAVKGKQCSYKGSRSIKNLDITQPANE
ncbi:MAG: hypothetical protein K2L86_02310 [Lachnospiraceae bacterium]|nr:hypothetical protein [Lachnospiraceae bacterium]